MAVVQISKIQLRRGKEQETGIPQLASGELAWAVDTQRLYIGNGAVSEGSPAVGNTRIVTTADNLLDIADRYIYKVNDSSTNTSGDSNFPVIRSLQERLDERVTAEAYGIFPSTDDQTTTIQRAIDNLFLNTDTKLNPDSRVTLEFGPGTYYFSSTIFIPSHCRIVGAGVQKTIFQFTGINTAAFEFINDDSTDTSRQTNLDPSPGVSTFTFINQPKHCLLKGFTLNTGDPTITAIKCNAVRDSVFEEIEMTGGFGDSSISTNSMGFGLYALSAIVTCQRNKFDRIVYDGFTYGIWSKYDINNNIFSNSSFLNCQYGVNLGTGAAGSQGQVYGPRNNTVKNNNFDNVDREGILVNKGYGNKSRGNTFVNVGNDGGGNNNNTYSQISFNVKGNSTYQDTFDRALDLRNSNLGETYLPEVKGLAYYPSFETEVVELSTEFGQKLLFRFPVSSDAGIEIDYIMSSNSITEFRKGKIHIAVDFSATDARLVDECEYTGSGNSDFIGFTATVVNNDLLVNYYNFNAGDVSTMTYTYRILTR
jgi:hypothetical protein